MSRCEKCDLYKESMILNCIKSYGNPSSPVYFVGEAPGAKEEMYKEPFVGQAGRVFSELLACAGFKKKDVFTQNSCRCRPKNNNKPTRDQILACRHYTVDEIRLGKPKLVVLMGNTALNSILGYQNITKYRGRFYTSEEFPDVTFFCTFHPAVMLYQIENKTVAEEDFRKIKAFLEDGSKVNNLQGVSYKNVTDIKSVRDMFQVLSKSSMVSFDCETTGLNFKEDKILCLSFSESFKSAYVLPLYGYKMREIWTPDEKKEVLSLLKNFFQSSTPKVGQNAKFDILFLHNMGIQVNGFYLDTMLAHHLIEEDFPHDLDYLCSKYTDMPYYSEVLGNCLKSSKAEEKQRRYALLKKSRNTEEDGDDFDYEDYCKRLKTDFNYSFVPEDILWKYSACDADATLRVGVQLIDRMEKEGVFDLYMNHVLPLYSTFMDVEEKGVLVDRNRLLALDAEYAKEIKRIEQEIYKCAGREFKIKSVKDLREVLFKEKGCPVLFRTKKDLPSCDEGVLQKLRDNHHVEIADKILEYRKFCKLKGTYLAGDKGDGGLLNFIYPDGRIHPSYLLHGTVTGRLSCRDPNMQNIPRTGSIRSLVVAPADKVFIEADYSQLELRIMAVIAKEPNMLKCFEEGNDLHAYVASLVFGKDIKDISKEERHIAKTIDFGLNYGRGAYSISEDLGIHMDEAKGYIDVYFGRFPIIKEWYVKVRRRIIQKKVLVNCFGRKRRFDAIKDIMPFLKDAKEDDEEIYNFWIKSKEAIIRQGTNFVIQSTGSDILSRATARIHKELRENGMDSCIIMSLHDALYCEVPEREIEFCVKIMKKHMEASVPELGDFIFPVDMKIGRYWGEMDSALCEKYLGKKSK